MKVRILLQVLLAFILSITIAGQFPQTASANIYLVTNTSNTGAGSLRQAILDANTNPGLDTITFSIPGTGVHTIQPTSSLPLITDPVIINGLSQGTANAGELWAGTDHTLLVELDGSLIATSADGLSISAGGSTVRGMIIHSFKGYGISLSTNGGNTIETNYIGTGPDGESDLGNTISGILLNNVGSNTIGGSAAGSGNLISGNGGSGILIQDSAGVSNQIKGNFIGTDKDGEEKIGNAQNGVALVNAPWNVIGGSTSVDRNLISGNGNFGVWISGTGAFFNRVRGNYIGTTRHGTVLPADIGNGMDGVYIIDSDNNTIGGDGVGEGNLISGNTLNGVRVTGGDAGSNNIYGNYIGTDINGTAVIANGGDGVNISVGASYTNIGGSGVGERNLISGNAKNGVNIQNSDFTTVEGNLIGTDLTGMTGLGNTEHGIQLSSMAYYNTVGGDTAAERNVISGNAWSGVQITGLGTDYNIIKGNFIGTDISGTSALPNGNDGVVFVSGARWNTVGGTNPGEGNLISGNTWSGVSIFGDNTDSNYVFGNTIGTDVNGTTDLGNSWIGVFVGWGAANNSVGGATANHRNVISGNDQDGVQLRGSSTNNNTISGNYIGLSADGESSLGITPSGDHHPVKEMLFQGTL